MFPERVSLSDRLETGFRRAVWCVICAVVILSVATRMAAAQSFPLTFSLPTGSGPLSTAIGDVNNDGALDLVTANSQSNSVSVSLGTGSGGFGPKTDFATDGRPGSVALGDMNGDGFLDMVTSNESSSTVSVLLGTGTGAFGARTDYITGSNPYALALDDLNADGRLDAVVANYSSSTVSVLFGTAEGGFGTKIDYATGARPYSVALGDLNGDGRPDMVVSNFGSNSVSVRLGTGAGLFGGRADYPTGNAPWGLAIGDLTGDGKPDLAVADYYAATVSILVGTGGGSFYPRTDFGTGAGPIAVAIGNFNGDGLPDLAVANFGASSVSILPASGWGYYPSKSDYPAGSNPYSVVSGDLNRDGKLDLVLPNYGSNTVTVLMAAGAGGFGPKTDFTAGAQATFVAIADLNGDGKHDLAVANGAPNTVSVLLGTGSGAFGPKTDFATGTNPYCIGIGRLDADTTADLAVVNRNSNTVSILFGNGDGSLGPKTDYVTGSAPEFVAIGNINGDGFPDLAVANRGASTVSILLGTGTGSFGPKTDFATGTGPGCVAIGSLNSDGHADLVVSNENANSVSVLLGNGDGTFGARTDFTTGIYPTRLALGDLNGDGKTDVAVPSWSGAVSVLLGTGGGNLAPRTDFAAGNWTYSVSIGDLNGDSRPDLATANYYSNTVSVLLGTGTGSFGPRSDFATGNAPNCVPIQDLNGDGRPDLVTSNNGSGTVSVLLGLEATQAVLTSTPNPSAAGGAVTLTATVSTVPPIPGPPTGTVNFFDGFTLLGTEPLNAGVATITAFPSALGIHRLTAVYGGTPQLLGRISAPVTQVVRRFYEIVTPNGGEQWAAGAPVVVRWRGKELADLAMSFDGGSAWSTLASGVGGSDENEYALTAPGFATVLAKVRVTQTGQTPNIDTSDQSDGVFTIVMPTTPPSAAVRLQAAPAGQAANDNFGLAVASAGDFNGDGFADQIVGAYLNDAAGADAGRAYIYFCGPSADAVADVTLTGAAAGDRLGVSVAGVGDVNRDGFDDVLVGADRNDSGGTDAGRAYLYIGGAAPDNLPDLTLTGGAAGDNFGVAVAAAGDVNDDGYADLLVGASVADGDSVDAGAAYLYLGGPALDSVADWTVRGEGRADYFGFAVASVGDVNGDRFDDFVVGAYQNSARLYHGGKVYLFLGGRPPDTAPDLEMHGRISEDFFGVAVAGAGDVDGDGFGDILVGAQGSDAGGLSSGVAYLFLGGPDIDDTPDVSVVGYAGEQLGRALAGVGDVNGDGFADFATGSRLNDDAGTDAGRVCVYHGGTAPDALPDVVLSGQANLDTFGRSVAGAGDANGDGFADLIVGADRNDFSALNAGRAYLYDFNRYHLLSPVGGEDWPVGALRTVHWLGTTKADIWLSADGGQTFDRLVDEAGGEAENTVALRVPHLPTRFARIQMRPSDPLLTGADQSDSLFTIEASVALLNFKAEPGEGGTLVSWSTNPTVGPEGLAGYRLYRVPPGSGEGPGVPIGPPLIMESSYRDAGAPAGAGYRLCAVNGLQQELELGRIVATAPFAGMRLWPSPARAGEAIHLVIATPFGPALLQAGLDIAVFDVSGRRVATVPTREPQGGNGQIELAWDGRDNSGQPVSSGIYFVSVRATAGPVSFRADQRLVVTR